MTIYQTRVGPIETNCYVVADPDGNAAVIDPGAEGERVNRILDEHHFQLAAILLTHGHFDHIGGVKKLLAAHPQAEVVIGEKDAPMLGNKPGAMWTPYIDLNDYTDLRATRLVREGDVIQVGSLSFAVLDTPGHTRGGVCYLCEDCLFSGDTLFRFECGRTDLDGGDYPTILRSLRKLHDLPGNYRVLPGHDELSSLEEERQGNPYMKEAVR